jgi:hypothetical protein
VDFWRIVTGFEVVEDIERTGRRGMCAKRCVTNLLPTELTNEHGDFRLGLTAAPLANF